MKLLFLLGDYGNSPERKLAREAEKLIGKDAEVVWYDPALPLAEGFEGVWIFTHEEEGGCPAELMRFLTEHFPAFEDVPTVASGIGGKEGGMNAAYEIAEYFEEHGGRFMAESEPLCVPMKTARFELGPEEKMDLFFLVDGFLKYCGMDKSESRSIAFETVVDDYFKLMKASAAAGERPTEVAVAGALVKTDAGDFDCAASDGLPPELRDLPYEIESLTEDYEIEETEIASALLEKILREW